MKKNDSDKRNVGGQWFWHIALSSPQRSARTWPTSGWQSPLQRILISAYARCPRFWAGLITAPSSMRTAISSNEKYERFHKASLGSQALQRYLTMLQPSISERITGESAAALFIICTWDFFFVLPLGINRHTRSFMRRYSHRIMPHRRSLSKNLSKADSRDLYVSV